jgi:hypothetical protein
MNNPAPNNEVLRERIVGKPSVEQSVNWGLAFGAFLDVGAWNLELSSYG